mgnify:CR=1 FL=1
MFDVITIGSGTVDVFVETGDKLFRKAKGKKGVVVPFGSKIVVEDVRFDIGGGGTNTAVALKRLGLKTAWLGCVGEDENSEHIIKLLKKEKVNTKFISKCNKSAGYSVILDAEGHDRTILAHKGSNNELEQKHINFKKLKTRWFYFSSMVGKSYKTLEKIAEFAEEKGARIAFNPSSYLVKKGKRFLNRVIKKTDVLIFNRDEAETLVGYDNIKMLLKRVHALGPKIVVITDGPKGAYCYDGCLTYKADSHKIKVVESTGAGDSFAASFLAGMIAKNDIKTALRWGVTNSESVISHYGAKNKLLSKNQLLSALKRKPVEVKVRL